MDRDSLIQLFGNFTPKIEFLGNPYLGLPAFISVNQAYTLQSLMAKS